MSVVAADGFAAAGVGAGLKAHGALDLAVVAAPRPGAAAALFTTSAAPAAPGGLSRRHLERGPVRAVVLNAGCANAGTGSAGLAAAQEVAAAAAGRLGGQAEQILLGSTGPIGPPLPVGSVVEGLGRAVASLGSGPEAGRRAAEAIMTTDTVPKLVEVGGTGYTVGGMAKGAGMVRPELVTMLAVLTSDARVPPRQLQEALRAAADASFHALDLDGCQSTNDTVVVLAGGASGVSPDPDEFTATLSNACRQLARQLAADAEGAGRVVTLAVSGAVDHQQARRMGRAMADSALVRASFFGGDPNWGRLLGAAAAAGLPLAADDFEVAYRGVTVARAGTAVPYDHRTLVAALATGDFDVAVQVGSGPGRAEILTVDLTPEYVRFNGEPS